MQAEELESMVVENLTDEFVTGAIRAVFGARQLAHEMCIASFEPPEVKNVKPLIVRAKLNEYLRGIAARLPNCTARVERSMGSPMQRTELVSGPIRLTAHTVQTPCGKVKKFYYRQSLAQANQPTLFDDEFPIGDTLYTLLLHGTYRPRTREELGTYDHLPGSIYLAFPTAELNHYVHRVDLISRYQTLVDSLLPNEWDAEARVFYRWQAAAQDVG